MRELTEHHDGHGLNESIHIYTDEPDASGAAHTYVLKIDHPGYDAETVGTLQYQKGPRNVEGSTPGVTEAALFAVLIDRLKGFQSGPLRVPRERHPAHQARRVPDVDEEARRRPRRARRPRKERAMSEAVQPKLEAVEYWHFVGNGGTQVTYMVRPEQNERGQVLKNPIDNTPVEVQILLRSCDDKNEVVGTLSFPVTNLFSYGMEKGTFAIWPKGQSPAELTVAQRLEDYKKASLVRKRRIEAVVGGIVDLRDGSEAAAETTAP